MGESVDAGQRRQDVIRRRPERSPAPAGEIGAQANLLTLQRLVGNSTVASMLSAVQSKPTMKVATALAQRNGDSPGTTVATPTKDAAPSVAPEAERGSTPAHPAPARPTFDLAGGQQILTAAFGKVKSIVPGKIELLDQAAFQAAYDKIYGSGEWSWAKYVKPKYGNLNGFADKGTNYINKATAGLHTIVHEMLHNNTAGDWRGVVGSRWDEGTTEILTQVACKLFNEPAPTTYPGESPTVQVALDHGLGLADLQEAYLAGGAQTKVAGWVDAHCVLTWTQVKVQMQAENYAAAKAGLALKPAAAPSTPGASGGVK